MVSVTGSNVKPVMALILAQLASGGVSIFYKLAFASGMKVQILVFYRLLTATFCIVPLALLMERNRPKLTWKIAVQGLTCGILGGALGSNLYAECLILTSATLATAMTNIIPALTLLMAVMCRLESIEIGKASGKAKVIGTALGLFGAMILTFYYGMTITLWSTNINLLNKYEKNAHIPHVEHNHLLGCLLALLSCICYAAWLIVQTKMSQVYPHFSSSAIICFAGAIISGFYALCREPHLNEWKLGFDIRLLSVSYMGIIGSGFVTVITAWGTRVRGPLYVSSFTPLALIFVALLGSLILAEKLNLGSIIGSVLIIVGLYVVLWGKSKDIDVPDSGSLTNGEVVLEMKYAGNSTVVPTDIIGDQEKPSEGVEEV